MKQIKALTTLTVVAVVSSVAMWTQSVVAANFMFKSTTGIMTIAEPKTLVVKRHAPVRDKPFGIAGKIGELAAGQIVTGQMVLTGAANQNEQWYMIKWPGGPEGVGFVYHLRVTVK